MEVRPCAVWKNCDYGNRPFMLAGLILWTAGLACLALIAHRHTRYLEMAPLLAIAGIGGPMVFTTVAGEVMGSVPAEQIGIASGTNNALRELGGVFGIAVLATVFNRPGVYSSPDTFVSGFRSALWVAVAFSAIGILLIGFLKPKAGRAADVASSVEPERAISPGASGATEAPEPPQSRTTEGPRVAGPRNEQR